MCATTYQTPSLMKWNTDRRARFEQARKADMANGLAYQLGCLEGWAEQADAELCRLRDQLARVNEQRDETDRELSMATSALEDARADAHRFTDEDAETARPVRRDAFSDLWEAADISAAFIPDIGFGHVHE